MKIAVLLFGHLRDFENCAPSLNEHLLSRYDCDVFIHTWDETEPQTKTWHVQRFQSSCVDEVVREKIKGLYDPKGLIIEHQCEYTNAQILHYGIENELSFSTAGPHFMFDSMSKANQLRVDYEKDNHINYDYVFVTRPDVQLYADIDIERAIVQARILGMNPESCRFYAAFNSGSGDINGLIINQPNDLLFYATPIIISKYISINKNLDAQFIIDHLINTVSVFTSKEISAGITPLAFAYRESVDWSFSGTRPIKKGNSIPKWKKTIFHIGALLLWPIFRLQKNHSWLNYYVYKERFAE